MKNIFRLFLLFAGSIFFQKGFSQSPDTLQLKNGQTLVGVFLGWQYNEINFLVTDVGAVSVNYKKVSKLNGNLVKYRIETSTRKFFYEKLTCVNPEEFVFTENGNPVSVPFKSIHTISPYKKGGVFSGFFGIGYNYARSNDFGLITLDGGLNINSKKWLLESRAMSTIVHTKIDSWNRNREFGSLKTHRIINPLFQIGTRYIYQRNKELGLAYRHLIGGGFEFNALKKPNLLLNLSSGFAGTFEKTFDDQGYSRLEFPILVEFKIYNLGGSNFSLSHMQTVFISTGKNVRIRHDGELRLNFQITKKLSLSTYIYDNYDSAPIQKIGTTNFDYGWNMGLRLTI